MACLGQLLPHFPYFQLLVASRSEGAGPVERATGETPAQHTGDTGIVPFNIPSSWWVALRVCGVGGINWNVTNLPRTVTLC